jgi:Domain of unknown function (DUF1887)
VLAFDGLSLIKSGQGFNGLETNQELISVLQRVATALKKIAADSHAQSLAHPLVPTEGAPAVFAEPATIILRLAEKGYSVYRLPDIEPPDPTLDAIAYLIGSQFEITKPLMRVMNAKDVHHLRFDLGVTYLGREQVGGLVNICTLLQGIGYLSEFRHESIAKRISGKIRGHTPGSVGSSDDAIKFINGGWLERCVRVHIRRFLNLDNIKIELAERVQITRPDARRFEMDTLLIVENSLYWWECKSGKVADENLLRYSEVAKSLDLSPECCFLVVADPQKGFDTDFVRNRYGFTVVPVERLEYAIEKIEDTHRR